MPAGNILRVVSFSMLGIGLAKNYLRDIVRWTDIKMVLDKEVEIARKEILRRAPRDTALMESWVRVKSFDSMNELVYMIYIPIGIDSAHPFYPLAMEFGTRYIKVGTPSRPSGRWDSKTKQGATMPFMRPAAVALKKRALKEIRNRLMLQIRSNNISAGFQSSSGIKSIRRV